MTDWKAWIQERVVVDERGCWLWQLRCIKNGYGQVSSSLLAPRVQVAHRLAWKVFKGPIPAGMCVCHSCDVRKCVNPDHLFIGTKRDNTWDMVRKGRHGSARLTPELVAEIKASKESSRAIGRRLGYDAGNIRHIRRGRIWECLGNS